MSRDRERWNASMLETNGENKSVDILQIWQRSQSKINEDGKKRAKGTTKKMVTILKTEAVDRL